MILNQAKKCTGQLKLNIESGGHAVSMHFSYLSVARIGISDLRPLLLERVTNKMTFNHLWGYYPDIMGPAAGVPRMQTLCRNDVLNQNIVLVVEIHVVSP